MSDEQFRDVLGLTLRAPSQDLPAGFAEWLVENGDWVAGIREMERLKLREYLKTYSPLRYRATIKIPKVGPQSIAEYLASRRRQKIINEICEAQSILAVPGRAETELFLYEAPDRAVRNDLLAGIKAAGGNLSARITPVQVLAALDTGLFDRYRQGNFRLLFFTYLDDHGRCCVVRVKTVGRESLWNISYVDFGEHAVVSENETVVFAQSIY